MEYLFSNSIRKRFQHRCFSVNIAKFLRAAFFIEHLRWLFLMAPVLLTISSTIRSSCSKLFYKKCCREKFLKIDRKAPVLECFLIKLQLYHVTWSKKRLKGKCFSVIFMKFFRTLFYRTCASDCFFKINFSISLSLFRNGIYIY